MEGDQSIPHADATSIGFEGLAAAMATTPTTDQYYHPAMATTPTTDQFYHPAGLATTPSTDQLYPDLDGDGDGASNGAPSVNITVNPLDGPEAVVRLEVPDTTASPQDEESTPIVDPVEDQSTTLLFRDGERKIDFVLCYQDCDDQKKTDRRDRFEKNLEKEGLELEREDKKHSQDGRTHYVKVHCPWEVLTRMAEILAIKMPIKEDDAVFNERGCLDCHWDPFDLPTDLVTEEKDYFTATFKTERQDMFIIPDKDTFFSNAQRSMFTYELLLRAQYDDTPDKIGIDRLLKQDVYSAAYPLHEGPCDSEHSLLTHPALNDRHLLAEVWARPGRWYFNQPMDLIRKYYGEKVGIYFAWLGFYTSALIPAALVGCIVFLYGLITMMDNAPRAFKEICDPNGAGDLIMCPLCDKRCTYWKLQSSCLYSKLTYLFDNHATVFFACFMAIWSMVFLEFWTRKQAEIQYDWDLAGYDMEERIRPEFEAKCQKKKVNPITQMSEPYLPVWEKVPRVCTSFVIVIFMICCVVMAVFGVIIYRTIIVTFLYAQTDNDVIRKNAKLATSCSAAFINLCVIMILNRLYMRVAVWLTEIERPRTDSEYEDSYTFKMFLFQFINFYSSIFYIAFIKGSVTLPAA